MSFETLLKNFELVVNSSEGVFKLRELILKLAFYGRLIPQEEDSESVSILFEKIKNERECLVKEKQIKSFFSSPIQQDEILFKIPQSWKWARIADIGQVVSGGTPRTEHIEYYAEQCIPWITPSDLYRLQEKFVKRGKKDITLLGLQKSSAKLMPAGTILFSSRAPIGYVAIAENDLATNQGFKSCVPFVMEMNEYIYYFLKFAAKDIERRASGTTFKEISGKEFSRILIPIPSLKEQKHIVERVDYLMSLCNLLEEKQKEVKNCQERIAEVLVYQASKVKL